MKDGKKLIAIADDEKEIREYKAAELRFKPRRRQERVQMDEELHALEQLERKEAKKQGE